LENFENSSSRKTIVAGYDWILTPASIFAGHFLKEFYSKFESILTDSFSLGLVKFLENAEKAYEIQEGVGNALKEVKNQKNYLIAVLY
jgi:hypothetical protein